MKIAAFVTSEIPFPIPDDFPRPYAPLQVAADIAEGLARRGHEVTLFGPRGSGSKVFKTFSAPITPLYKSEILGKSMIRSIEREKIYSLFDQYIVSSIFAEHQKHPFDIIHIHPIDRAMPFARLFPDVPIAYTIHDPIYPWRADLFRIFQTPNQHFVSISNNQRIPAPDLNYAATIYNGIDVKNFPFSDKKGDYLFFSGRLQENKGVYEAIQAAEISGEKLLIAGGPAEGEYWEEKIKPHLNEKIKYVGFLTGRKLYEYYKNAKATLMPVKWEEPFGLVMTESMACGTPVIAFRRGSVPEVVKDGETGFVVDESAEAMADAIGRIDLIDRTAARKRAELNFSNEHMTDGYEKLFSKLCQKT